MNSKNTDPVISIEGKTLQQVSDEIAAALIKQGRCCVSSTIGACAYGNADNEHCAVGMLLPNIPFFMDFKGSIHKLIKHWCIKGDIQTYRHIYNFLFTNATVLLHLQNAHDRLEIPAVTKEIDLSAWEGWAALKNNPPTDQ